MAIVQVSEIPQNHGMVLGERWRRSYRRQFVVRTNAMTDGPLQVISAEGIPRLYSSYEAVDGSEGDVLARCNEIRPQQDPEDPFTWHVECGYQSLVFDFALFNKKPGEKFDSGDQALGPLYKIPDVRWGFAPYQRIAKNTIARGSVSSLPIVNSSGEPFDPPVMKDDARLVLTLVRNEPTYDPLRALLFKDAINQDTFLGAQPGTAKCANIGSVRKFESDIVYQETTYEIHFRAFDDDMPLDANGNVPIDPGTNLPWSPWQPALLDQGYYDSKGNLLKDSNGSAYSSPQPLDGKGSRLAQGQTPVFLYTPVYRQIPFASLMIKVPFQSWAVTIASSGPSP